MKQERKKIFFPYQQTNKRMQIDKKYVLLGLLALVLLYVCFAPNSKEGFYMGRHGKRPSMKQAPLGHSMNPEIYYDRDNLVSTDFTPVQPTTYVQPIPSEQRILPQGIEKVTQRQLIPGVPELQHVIPYDVGGKNFKPRDDTAPTMVQFQK